MAEKSDKFRVIIVGGGPVALTAAHAFEQAGIDYLLLERRGILDVDSGASVAVWPHNVRLLDQFGLLEEAERTYMPVKYKRNLREDGSELSRSNMFEAIGINHGHKWMCFHRAKLMSMLSSHLIHQNHVLLDKEVVSMETTTSGVTLTCADQTTYSGSIVVGADGVHSTVRRLMNQAADSHENPFISTYRGLYGYSTRSPALEPGILYETHSKNFTIQLIVAEEQQHFLVYERLPKPTTERTRYSQEDQDACAQRFADVKFPGMKSGDIVTFGDVWGQKKWSMLANLEEGIAAKWYSDRCVLVGDAVHKMTPNTGFGMNSGLQGVAQLANRLHGLVKEVPEPDTETLSKLFHDYQSARLSNSKEAVDMSALYTRLVAWNNPVWKFVDQFVLPYINGDVTSLNLLMSPIVQKGIALDFLEEKSFKSGKYSYKGPTPTVST
ncbi:FAD binding domain-containing protein [Xylariales sp. PMI_506]|nr:FAD binding domain-containing protein [Xylariales sp. PMI_506]